MNHFYRDFYPKPYEAMISDVKLTLLESNIFPGIKTHVKFLILSPFTPHVL